MITPKDIESKVFTTGFKGYKREEVDQFLDELMVEVQSLLQENENLKANIADLRAEVENRKESESSIMRTLEQAKSLMSDISASAEKRAEAIIRNAQSDAARIVQEAKESVTSMNMESDNIRNRVSDFKERYRMMLKDELKKVEGSAGDFFQDLRDDFFPASMTGEMPTQTYQQPAYTPQNPQENFAAQEAYAAAQEAYAPQENYAAQDAYVQQEAYAMPQEGFPMQDAYAPQPEMQAAPIFTEQPAPSFGQETVYTEAPQPIDPAVAAGLFPEDGSEKETTDTDDLMKVIEEDLQPADEMGSTLHGLDADFSAARVDDMAKTIVIDSEEMSRLNGEN